VVLDTDASEFGGSGAAGGEPRVESVPCHGQARSLVIDLPPLATVFLVPGAAP
jgi:1,4-alpha-glucan branching enzyme